MASSESRAWLPPAWFIHTAWRVHRALNRLRGGRFALWEPKGTSKWGTMRLTVTGRHSGRERNVILAYFEDGPNLVTMAMNGWQDGHPAWWLNLQANPDALITLHEGERRVRARVAEGDEHARLWAHWLAFDKKMETFAKRRSTNTAVVVLEPLAPTAAS